MIAILPKIQALLGLFKSKSTIYIALICFSIGFFSAYYIKSQFAKADLYRIEQAQNEILREAIRRTIDEYETRLELDNEVIAEWDSRVDHIRSQTANIPVEIVKYVKVNSDCNVPVGVVRLLNIARTGGDAGVRIPNASGDPDEAGRAASTVTQQREYSAHSECAVAYRELSERHSALTKWIKGQSK